MGYTHFSKVSGETAVAVGVKGSEVDIADSSGNLAQAGTTITATGAEINRVADKSSKVVGITSATTLTMAAHDSKIVTLGHASGVTVTLPAATGSGFECTLIAGVTLTGGSNVVQVANATDVLNGSVALGVDNDGEGATGFSWMAEAGDDTITMDGTTTGGIAGDSVKIIDYKAGFFKASVELQQSGTSATPFTAAVT